MSASSSTPQPALVVIRGEASVAEFAAVDLTDAGPARGAPTVLSRIHDISDSLATKPMRDNSVQQRSPPKSQNPWGTQSRTGSRRSSRESREQKQARHVPSQSGDRPHSSRTESVDFGSVSFALQPECWSNLSSLMASPRVSGKASCDGSRNASYDGGCSHSDDSNPSSPLPLGTIDFTAESFSKQPGCWSISSSLMASPMVTSSPRASGGRPHAPLGSSLLNPMSRSPRLSSEVRRPPPSPLINSAAAPGRTRSQPKKEHAPPVASMWQRRI